MKIAISATGKDLNSAVDPRFGRADYLIIADTESGGIVQIIDNLAAKDASQGAGINAASRIAESGAQAVLTGRMGPKSGAVCEKAGIAIVNNVSGSVQDAINNYGRTTSTPQSQFQSNVGPDRMAYPQGQRKGQGMAGGRGCGGGGGRGCGGGGRQR